MTKVTAAEILFYPSRGVKHCAYIISLNLYNSPMSYYFHVKEEETGTKRLSNSPKFTQVQWVMNTGLPASRTQTLFLIPAVVSGFDEDLGVGGGKFFRI